MGGRGSQPVSREGQAGSSGMTDRLVVPLTPGNAGRGKGPDFWVCWKWLRVGILAIRLSDPVESSAATEGTLSNGEEGVLERVAFLIDWSFRVPFDETSRRAGCGKSARPVR